MYNESITMSVQVNPTKILMLCIFCIYAHHIAFKSDFVSNTAGALGVSGASPMRCTNSAVHSVKLSIEKCIFAQEGS